MDDSSRRIVIANTFDKFLFGSHQRRSFCLVLCRYGMRRCVVEIEAIVRFIVQRFSMRYCSER